MKAERGICSSCQRDIAIDTDGNVWPHGGAPGSGVRCRGTGRPPQSNLLIDLIKESRFTVQDRVQKKGTNMSGVVLETTPYKVNVWWGTRPHSRPGMDGVPVTSWEDEDELEWFPEPIWFVDDVGNKEQVWAGRGA